MNGTSAPVVHPGRRRGRGRGPARAARRAPRRQRPRGRRRRARGRHDPRAVAAALGEARPASRWRMEVHERPDGVTVVNDAYNANPDSMRAALKALAAMGRAPRGPGRCSARCSSSGPTRRRARRDRAAGRAPRHLAARRRRRGRPADRQRRPPRGVLGAGVRLGPRRRRGLRPAAAASCAPATSCCSSPAATPGCGGSATGSSDLPETGSRPREGRPARRRRLAGHRAARHPAVHQVPRPARLRPVHPRRRTDLAPHQARHARPWAAPSSSARPSRPTSRRTCSRSPR